MAGIEEDSRTVTTESFRLEEKLLSRLQLQSVGIGGNCSVTSENEQTQLCGRSKNQPVRTQIPHAVLTAEILRVGFRVDEPGRPG